MAGMSLLSNAGTPAGRAARAAKARAAAAARRVFRAAKRAAWVAKKAGYYLLPPVLHSGLKAVAKALAPRVLQPAGRAQLKAALAKRYAPPAPAIPPGEPFAGPVVVPPDPAAVEAFAWYTDAFRMPEDNHRQITAKAAAYREIAGRTRIDRVRLLREVARLELAADEPVKACLYAARAMRLLGRDEYDDLLWVRPALTAAGYGPEAAAVAAMYAKHGDRDAACDALIRAADAAHRRPAPLADEYEIVDDRRGPAAGRVAVVMTLYNGANKLRAFLEALQLQTLNRAGGLELVIVDSCSPSNEYAALRETVLRYPIPTLFVRTKHRETIQTAWNRGIGLARAPYLSLLGVDEGVAPETFAHLAGHLDADPTLDWVQGDILLTEVDQFGAQATDIMTYDKAGFRPELVYLETCYLGPVGAVHRKAMHDRVGYFDGTFRAAGDTEFKNRVLPRIRVKTVPKVFGLYLNYPEERTTASPRAELEDFRAWYLHRTPAGMRAAFATRPDADLESFLPLALRYRKSYVRHYSSDFELADVVARLVRERVPASPRLALAPGVARVLAALRLLDHLPAARPDVSGPAVAEVRATIAAVRAEHRAAGWVPDADYDPFRDNRHEQHHTFW